MSDHENIAAALVAFNPYADRGQPLEVRFHNRYVVDPSGCWIWISTVNTTGYGMMKVDGTQRVAHRVSFELHNGPVPDGLVLDHLCRTKRCVNPAHVEAVTQAENVRRHNEATGQKQYAQVCRQGHDLDAYGHHRAGYRRCAECDRANARRRHRERKAGA